MIGGISSAKRKSIKLNSYGLSDDYDYGEKPFMPITNLRAEV